MFHSIQCPNCHQQSPSDDVFCVNCGVRLTDNSDPLSHESRNNNRSNDCSSEQFSSDKKKQSLKDVPTKAILFFRSIAIRMLWALGLTSVFVVPLFGYDGSFRYWASLTSLILLVIWLFFVLLALICYTPSIKRVLAKNGTTGSNAYHQEWNMLKDLGVYLFWSTITSIVSLWPPIDVFRNWSIENQFIYLSSDVMLMVLLCGLLFSIICIRFGKKDIHNRRFCGILSGIAVAFVVIFCLHLFPLLLEYEIVGTERWAVDMLLVICPFTIVLIYVFGPFSLMIREQKE